MARLTAPNGATVVVPDDQVDELQRRGFSSEDSSKSTAKKASSSKSSK